MTGSIETRLEVLAEEFELLGEWEERYRYVIDLGRELAARTEAEHSDAYKVRGCASHFGLVTQPQADGNLAFDAANVVYVSNFTTTPVQLICKNKVIAKVEDIKGIKVRATGFYGNVLEDLGATVLRFSGVEAGRAMDAGTINCNMNYLYGMRTLRDYESAQDITRMDWGQFLAWAIVVNKSTWNKLTPAHQKTLREVGDAMVDKVAENMVSASDNAVKAMTAGIDGKVVRVHAFPAPEKTRLMQAGKKYEEDWKKKAVAAGYNADKLLADFLALTAKYEKEREAKGYPWKR